MQDNRKSSLVARISMQVIDYYRQALRGLEDSNISSLMGSRKSKTWRKTIQIKIAHFLSVAYVSDEPCQLPQKSFCLLSVG